jgi:hypothetical protein
MVACDNKIEPILRIMLGHHRMIVFFQINNIDVARNDSVGAQRIALEGNSFSFMRIKGMRNAALNQF